MIVIIDNYDSFTYNLYQYIGEYTKVEVYRNDKIDVLDIRRLKPKGIVISPGPGRPENTGNVLEIINEFHKEIPILGICLGHQAIGYYFGCNIIKAKKIYHGKKSDIKLKGKNIFDGIKRNIEVMRYHSLVIDKVGFSKDLEIIAESVSDMEIMAIKHKVYEIYGLQFHPESIGTEKGKRIIENFIGDVCGENL